MAKLRQTSLHTKGHRAPTPPRVAVASGWPWLVPFEWRTSPLRYGRKARQPRNRRYETLIVPDCADLQTFWSLSYFFVFALA